MVITVYVSCCGADKALAAVDEATKQAGVTAQVELVRDLPALAKAGVMSTPAIKIDGRMIVSGRVPRVPELVGWLKSVAGK
jgi:hypothetical protein